MKPLQAAQILHHHRRHARFYSRRDRLRHSGTIQRSPDRPSVILLTPRGIAGGFGIRLKLDYRH